MPVRIFSAEAVIGHLICSDCAGMLHILNACARQIFVAENADPFHITAPLQPFPAPGANACSFLTFIQFLEPFLENMENKISGPAFSVIGENEHFLRFRVEYETV